MSVEQYYNKLLERHVPTFYLHFNEKYFPCSIDWILQYSTLIDHNSGIIIHKPKSRDLYQISKRYNFTVHNRGDIVLSLSYRAFTGQNHNSEIPVYGYYKIIDQHIYITYIIIHAYNGDYKIGGFSVGSHPFDIEHITIQLDYSHEISRVYFSSHNSGQWITRKDLIIEGDKLVGFIALNGHGIYPYSGVYLRYFGFGNDYTDRGIKWTPGVEVIDFYYPHPDHHGWFLFNGRFGGSQQKGDTSGVSSLLDKQWIRGIYQREDPLIYFSPENYKVLTISGFISLYIITGALIYFKIIKNIRGILRRRLMFIFIYTITSIVYYLSV